MRFRISLINISFNNIILIVDRKKNCELDKDGSNNIIKNSKGLKVLKI